MPSPPSISRCGPPPFPLEDERAYPPEPPALRLYVPPLRRYFHSPVLWQRIPFGSHHPALTDKTAVSPGQKHKVRIPPFPIQREQVYGAALLMVLFADRPAVHAENADVPVPQSVMVDKIGRAYV